MKRLIFFLLVMGMGVSLFAEIQLPEHRFVSGNWSIVEDRVYQNDANAVLAKVNIKVPQRGAMIYKFNVRYESGAEDGHGGFGLHIFGDTVFNGPSWGSGKSYLLWLNYDEKPQKNSGIPVGLSGQVYRSYSNSRMELVRSIDLNQYADLLTLDNLASPVSFSILVNGDTGEVRIYDPVDPAVYYLFNVDKKDLPLKGDWVVLRTNSIKLSFAPEQQ